MPLKYVTLISWVIYAMVISCHWSIYASTWTWIDWICDAVFKYDAPNATSFPHSVYMFKSFGSFLKCDIKKAKMLANPTQGSGEGFKFVLKKWQPHYFACGERNGFHCNNGTMKFAVMPMFRPFWKWPWESCTIAASYILFFLYVMPKILLAIQIFLSCYNKIF